MEVVRVRNVNIRKWCLGFKHKPEKICTVITELVDGMKWKYTQADETAIRWTNGPKERSYGELREVDGMKVVGLKVRDRRSKQEIACEQQANQHLLSLANAQTNSPTNV
ncbi:hypothetical protein VC83_00473 [Pseudogymnoascus destructans]|uniref:Uncharacterized protein n=1 Tax=Pseudogymnoascus destructans TaxID=655981 RepID=A0A177AP12_9PEZI|nr:uncharacterized protein VC83_00473 [Pseudogymnoascus destructans]OAF63101.1 hypothetical protein VC83_00473 [Pseudogymnoascus destructans]